MLSRLRKSMICLMVVTSAAATAQSVQHPPPQQPWIDAQRQVNEQPHTNPNPQPQTQTQTQPQPQQQITPTPPPTPTTKNNQHPQPQQPWIDQQRQVNEQQRAQRANPQPYSGNVNRGTQAYPN